MAADLVSCSKVKPKDDADAGLAWAGIEPPLPPEKCPPPSIKCLHAESSCKANKGCNLAIKMGPLKGSIHVGCQEGKEELERWFDFKAACCDKTMIGFADNIPMFKMQVYNTADYINSSLKSTKFTNNHGAGSVCHMVKSLVAGVEAGLDEKDEDLVKKQKWNKPGTINAKSKEMKAKKIKKTHAKHIQIYRFVKNAKAKAKARLFVVNAQRGAEIQSSHDTPESATPFSLAELGAFESLFPCVKKLVEKGHKHVPAKADRVAGSLVRVLMEASGLDTIGGVAKIPRSEGGVRATLLATLARVGKAFRKKATDTVKAFHAKSKKTRKKYEKEVFGLCKMLSGLMKHKKAEKEGHHHASHAVDKASEAVTKARLAAVAKAKGLFLEKRAAQEKEEKKKKQDELNAKKEVRSTWVTVRMKAKMDAEEAETKAVKKEVLAKTNAMEKTSKELTMKKVAKENDKKEAQLKQYEKARAQKAKQAELDQKAATAAKKESAHKESSSKNAAKERSLKKEAKMKADRDRAVDVAKGFRSDLPADELEYLAVYNKMMCGTHRKAQKLWGKEKGYSKHYTFLVTTYCGLAEKYKKAWKKTACAIAAAASMKRLSKCPSTSTTSTSTSTSTTSATHSTTSTTHTPEIALFGPDFYFPWDPPPPTPDEECRKAKEAESEAKMKCDKTVCSVIGCALWSTTTTATTDIAAECAGVQARICESAIASTGPATSTRI
jgi:hypothetical protein